MNVYTIKAINEDEAKVMASNAYNSVVISTFDYKKYNNVPEEKIPETMGIDLVENEGILGLKYKAPTVSRINSFNLENIITEGNSSKKLVYEILDSDRHVYASLDSKKDALKKGKELIKELKKDLVCEKVYRVDPEHVTAFKLTYTPPELNTYVLITK